MKHGFLRVATAQPLLKVGDCQYNAERISGLIDRCVDQDVDVVLFPELSLTGGSCGELLYSGVLLDAAMRELATLVLSTRGSNTIVIVGLPIKSGVEVCSSAAVIYNGQLIGFLVGVQIPSFYTDYIIYILILTEVGQSKK